MPAYYPQWRVEYGKMESRAYLSSSLTRLREACHDSTSATWWSRIETSGWLTNVARLLSCAKFVAISVHRDGKLPYPPSPHLYPYNMVCVAASVVVHGAAGMDSTLQVTALAQILLDPATRTMAG